MMDIPTTATVTRDGKTAVLTGLKTGDMVTVAMKKQGRNQGSPG
jgi:hypothetical protein